MCRPSIRRTRPLFLKGTPNAKRGFGPICTLVAFLFTVPYFPLGLFFFSYFLSRRPVRLILWFHDVPTHRFRHGCRFVTPRDFQAGCTLVLVGSPPLPLTRKSDPCLTVIFSLLSIFQVSLRIRSHTPPLVYSPRSRLHVEFSLIRARTVPRKNSQEGPSSGRPSQARLLRAVCLSFPSAAPVIEEPPP